MARPLMAAFGAVTVIAALTVSSPAAAAPEPGVPALAPGDTAATAPAVVSALQRDLGLTAEQVHARLAREATAARTEAGLRAGLGAAYAGAWLNADATTLHVGVTTKAA